MIPATDMRRLRSLVLLLGSPVDGEVTAAARGMTRLLDRHGLTLHDLVDSLAPDAARVKDTGPGPVDSEGWHDIASWLATHSDALTKKQQDFVRQARFNLHHHRGNHYTPQAVSMTLLKHALSDWSEM